MPPKRSDTIAEKISLLETAYKNDRQDLAMSLAASIKDTLSFERQSKRRSRLPVHAGVDEIGRVADLPPAWAAWAEGWSHYHSITLFETVGAKREREPAHLRLTIAVEQMNNPRREIRVARVINGLEEIPSQVLEHVRNETEHYVELAILADVDMHDSSSYLIFYGNANAELPNYITDLEVRGEGYGLEIENQYFQATLSEQMGQLVRMTYKREHGLELYAGGKGHGEPPTIDWAHDYVDEGHFQKIRMRNWAECPNWQVQRGPVCVRVRRWGFPHGPVHPLFTPSRIHMDQTYTFYAGLPHFFKEGEIEAIKDVKISAMRDDEWVFSGYSFDEILWIDKQGKVHEGKVPADQTKDLWGVGFFHSKSRDLLVALRLEHEADNFPGIQHGGTPTLHYHGHGQIWARYPANEADLKAGTVFRQNNAYLVADYPVEGGREEVAQLRHQLVNPLEIRSEDLPAVEKVKPVGRLARQGETKGRSAIKRAVWKALDEVRDNQLYQLKSSIVELGYVYDVRVEDGVAYVLVTMPHRGRPVYEFLVTQGGGRVDEGIQENVLRVKGIRKVVVDFTWEPGWDINRVSEKAKQEMGL
ncbi:MAG: iron-sulfur cluster assembly protein [Verrucomicrobiota bacterium]